MFFHGTDKRLQVKDLKKNYGRFGTALYLFNCPNLASEWGDNVIKINIEHPSITIDYRWLKKFSPDLSIEEEEGLSNLREFVDYPFIEIAYEDGTSEFVLYDLSLIEI